MIKARIHRLYLSLVDGSSLPLNIDSGIKVINALASDDVRPPPRLMVIEAQLPDGRMARILVPYDDDGLDVVISIDGDDAG